LSTFALAFTNPLRIVYVYQGFARYAKKFDVKSIAYQIAYFLINSAKGADFKGKTAVLKSSP